MAADLQLLPAPPMPPVDGAVAFNIRTPWLRGSGAGAVQRPISEPARPKATTATAIALRKLAADSPREFSRRLTDTIAKGFAAKGWQVPK